MANRAAIAAYFHRRQCEDSRFGYTQGDGRWGSGPTEDWEYDGVVGHFSVGDRDCSSSVIDCWQEALRGSSYEGALSGATYTGNMRSVFVNSGLFEWKPMSFIAQTGDIYLNESDHTAMCQSAEPDVLSEFVINEWGGIVNGQRGDQTGWESRVRGYYDFPWDGILHYNGKADDDMEPHDVWEYNWRDTAPNGNMYNCVLDIHKNAQPHSMWEYYWIDKTGKNTAPGGNMYNCALSTNETVMAVKQDVKAIKAEIEKLKISGASVDYDKLANKVADVIYARMKQ